MNSHVNLSGVRRRKIAQLVDEQGSVKVRDLCEQFGMSEATIRRDLRQLGAQGIVTRTHGGVMINSGVGTDLPNEERKQVAAEEKRRIGIAAIDMLAGDEVVFLDAGTTTLAVADHAHRKPGCRYVTTCLGVARRLRSQEIADFFMIGGSYARVNDSFVGSLAISALRSLSFDISFLCCSAVDMARRAIAIRYEAYSQIQREVIASSKRNVVIAHSEKFGSSGFVCTARFDELDGVITGSELDGAYLEQLESAKLQVVLA